jgi:plastocyanin
MRTVRQALVQIEGENPTLTLVTGEEYTLEWTNVNGGFHNFMIETTGEETPVETETMSEEGGTQTVNFTVTEEMTTYYCNPRRGLGMEGDVETV